MAQQPLDVYRDWLGIAEAARPLNYYQLLRLPAFEDNVSKIRAVYRKMNAHVRKFAAGDYAAESQSLLNELAKAMLCLTDADRKREYDATLGRKESVAGRRRALEEILLANKIIDQEQLGRARSFANAVGLSVRDAVVQQKLAAPDVVMTCYAESLGIPYVELDDVGVDEKLAACVPPNIARQHSCVPVMIDQGQLLMASPNPLVPDVEEELRLRFSMPIRSVLCTAGSVNQAIAKYFPRDMVAVAPVAVRKQTAAPAAAPAEGDAAEVNPAARTPKEQARREQMVALTAFSVTVFLSMLFKMFMMRDPNFHLTTFVVIFGIAAVVGVIGWVAAKVLKL